MTRTLSPQQATESKALKAGLKLIGLGYWIVAIHPETKRPIGKAWGLTRWDQERLRSTFERYPNAGIGICLGPGRAPGGAGLIDIEGDGDQAKDSLAKLLGGEVPDTPAWSSRRGEHNLFIADIDRLQRALIAAGAVEGKDEKGKGAWHLPEFPGLELRIGGLKADDTVKQVQSVVPPTPGDDGRPRAWLRVPRGGIAPLPEAAHASLEGLAKVRGPAGQQPAGPAGQQPAGKRGSRKAGAGGYGRAALKAECDQVEAATEGNRNNRLNSAAFSLGQLIGAGALDRAEVEQALLESARRAGLGEGESIATIRSGIGDGIAKPRDLNGVGGRGRPPSDNGNGRHDAGNDRPAIEITTERHHVAEDAVNALGRDPDLYRRGDMLGIVILEDNPTAWLPSGVKLAKAQGSARFVGLSDANVGCRLTKNATFFKWSRGRGNGEPTAVNCHPPDWLIKAIASRVFWPGVRTLHTLADCPYVRADGSIPAAGFDDATGTLYRPSVVIPSLPTQPTQRDAKDAADRLFRVVHEFPFADGFDWSVWLAALLTSIQRPTIAGPVPGMVFNGNKAGIGKGLLIDVIGITVWGHPIPTRTYPMDPIEAGKVKLSLALAGVPAVHFDNLPEGGFFGNSEIDSALTSTEVSGRILGQSRESGPVPLRPCWFLSGNNVSPSRDAYRRWLPSNLRSNLESPHERRDVKVSDLRKWVRDHRAALLHDALVILKAHAIAGRPVNGWGPLGSFEEWDGIVRGAVWFATGNDCLHTQRKATEEMPERLDKIALLEGWAQLPEGGPDGGGITVGQALDLVTSRSELFTTLHSTFLRTSKDGKLPSPRQIGNQIRAMNGQNIAGHKFVRCGETRDHDSLWKVANA